MVGISNSGILKQVDIRELPGRMWVAVANGSEPLVVSEDVATALLTPTKEGARFVLGPLSETLFESGFFVSSSNQALPPIRAPLGVSWKIARGALWFIGLLLALSVLLLLIKKGVPDGSELILAAPHPLLAVIVAVGVAIATSVPHELAHVIFGRTFTQPRGTIALHAKRAVATTNLTHVWTWPRSPRLAAVTAGIVIDLFFLLSALVLRCLTGSWIATIGVSVMVMRVIWQFRFHRRCDGRHIAKMLIDDPSINTEAWSALAAQPWTLVSGSALVWISLVFIGVIAELFLIAMWMLPAVVQLLALL